MLKQEFSDIHTSLKQNAAKKAAEVCTLVHQMSYLICGVDEAGRGPLAGSVYAAAVILDDE